MSFILQTVAAGFCPPGMTPGEFVQSVDGCRVVNNAVGAWTIENFGSIPENERVLTLTPGPGTNAGGNHVTWGVSAGGPTAIGFAIQMNDLPLDAGMYFKLERRVSNR